jgi:hypothetical protein
LSRAALKVLAIVAYRQPIIGAEVFSSLASPVGREIGLFHLVWYLSSGALGGLVARLAAAMGV